MTQRRNIYVHYVFLRQSITRKILLLSSCYILLLTIRNHLIIQEEAIEGRDTSPPHSSNFRQDWISKLCYIFCPVEVRLEDNCIFLGWQITYFEWKFYLFSSHVFCLQTQSKSSAGKPGFIQAVQGSFFGFGPQCCDMSLSCLGYTSVHYHNLWFPLKVCAEKLSLPV